MNATTDQGSIRNGMSYGISNQSIQFKAVEVTPEEHAIAAARRKFDAAVELLNAFDPSAVALEEAAKAIAKVAHKAMKGGNEPT